MSASRITVRFADIDSWERNQENVDRILEKDTGTSEYPATKSMPPIIVGPEVSLEALDELKALDGVNAQTMNDD